MFALQQLMKFDNIMRILFWLCGTVVLTAWILLIVSAYKLSAAKAYGTRKREACGVEYLEAETARYEIYNAFNGSVRKLFRTSIMMLMTVGLIPLFVAIGVSIFIPWKQQTLKGWKSSFVWLFPILTGMVATAFLKFWGSEVKQGKVSAYLSKFNRPFQQNPMMRSVKMLTAFVPILVLLIIGTLLLNGMQFNLTTDTKSAWLGILLRYTILTIIIGTVLAYVYGDYQTLQTDIAARYSQVKARLETVVSSLLGNTDFKRYLEINVKRYMPNLENNPNLDSAKIKDRLYSFVEHRPGNDTFGYNSQYIMVNKLKEVFDPFIKGTTSIDDRAALLRLLQLIYTQGSVDDKYLFKVDKLAGWMHEIFGKDTPVSLGLQKSFGKMVTETNAGITGLTYKSVNGVVEAYIAAPIDGDGNAISRFDSEETKKRLTYLMYEIVHRSEYKESELVSYDTVHFYLDNDSVINDEVIANISETITKYEKSPTVDSSVSAFQRALRMARESEEPMIESTDLFLRHMMTVSLILVAAVVYIVFHQMYVANKGAVVLFTSATILFGIFLITWYSWFYAKLKL